MLSFQNQEALNKNQRNLLSPGHKAVSLAQWAEILLQGNHKIFEM